MWLFGKRLEWLMALCVSWNLRREWWINIIRNSEQSRYRVRLIGLLYVYRYKKKTARVSQTKATIDRMIILSYSLILRLNQKRKKKKIFFSCEYWNSWRALASYTTPTLLSGELWLLFGSRFRGVTILRDAVVALCARAKEEREEGKNTQWASPRRKSWSWEREYIRLWIINFCFRQSKDLRIIEI